MRVGVTGGAGFIGSHVVDQLLTRGHQPLIFDHHGRRPHHADVEVMLGDIRDATAVTELAAHTDALIHLAAVLGTQETVGNPRPAAETNILGGINVLEAAAQYRLPIVNITVGNAGMANPYSATKTCVESLGHMYVKDRGLRLNQVRAVNAYGPRQSAAAPFGPARVRKIMPAMICRALSGLPIEVYGDGSQISDCVYVTDVAHVLVAALEHATAGPPLREVVEVGPVEHHTVGDIAELVARTVTDRGYPLVDIRHLPMRPGETPGARVTARTDTLQHLAVDPAGFVPLADGIARTVDAFTATQGSAWHRPGTHAA